MNRPLLSRLLWWTSALAVAATLAGSMTGCALKTGQGATVALDDEHAHGDADADELARRRPLDDKHDYSDVDSDADADAVADANVDGLAVVHADGIALAGAPRCVELLRRH
jgi:hypothetical protein